VTKESVRRDLAIREAWHAMSDLVLNNERRREILEQTGLNFGKMRALRRVAVRPMPMRELAEQLAVDPPNLTPMVDELERLGLVERRAFPSDRRVKLVAATPKGAALAQRAEEILDRPPVGLVDLAPEELDILLQILARVQKEPETAH
jgi:DNA-binding MarR family transcriptional regulator